MATKLARRSCAACRSAPRPAAAGTHFRVWAPDRSRVTVVLEDRETALEREPDGYFAGLVAGRRPRQPLPLPPRRRRDAARSRLALPARRPARPLDGGRSRPLSPGATPAGPACRARPVLYELHLGTFTPEGTCAAAAAKLPHLAGIGITCIELMPVADFPGGFGWGYDGVALFAPTRLYGEPDELRAFVDAAHGHGIGVILDVVYNHIGQVGDVLKVLRRRLLLRALPDRMGRARSISTAPAARRGARLRRRQRRDWVDEFHIDGFRVDATQNVYDFDAATSTSWRWSRARRARPPRPAACWWWARTSRRTCGCCATRPSGGYGLRRPVERRFPPHAPGWR